jgi:hypothetical protein
MTDQNIYLWYRWNNSVHYINIIHNEYGLLFKKNEENNHVFVNRPQGNCYVMVIGRLNGHLVFYTHYLCHSTFQDIPDDNYEALGWSYDDLQTQATENHGQVWRSNQTAMRRQGIADYSAG